jgi:hypothetical protein
MSDLDMVLNLFSKQFFEFAKLRLSESEVEYFELDFETWYSKNHRVAALNVEGTDFWRKEFNDEKLKTIRRIHHEFVSIQTFNRVTNRI